jgi:hypothetical protein
MWFVVCFVASSLLSCTSLVHTVRQAFEYHEHFQCLDSLIILCNELWASSVLLYQLYVYSY